MNWVGGARHRLNDIRRGERKKIKDYFERQRLQTRHSNVASRDDGTSKANDTDVRHPVRSRDVIAVQSHSSQTGNGSQVTVKRIAPSSRHRKGKKHSSMSSSHEIKVYKKQEEPEPIPVPKDCLTLFGEIVPRTKTATSKRNPVQCTSYNNTTESKHRLPAQTVTHTTCSKDTTRIPIQATPLSNSSGSECVPIQAAFYKTSDGSSHAPIQTAPFSDNEYSKCIPPQTITHTTYTNVSKRFTAHTTPYTTGSTREKGAAYHDQCIPFNDSMDLKRTTIQTASYTTTCGEAKPTPIQITSYTTCSKDTKSSPTQTTRTYFGTATCSDDSKCSTFQTTSSFTTSSPASKGTRTTSQFAPEKNVNGSNVKHHTAPEPSTSFPCRPKSTPRPSEQVLDSSEMVRLMQRTGAYFGDATSNSQHLTIACITGSNNAQQSPFGTLASTPGPFEFLPLEPETSLTGRPTENARAPCSAANFINIRSERCGADGSRLICIDCSGHSPDGGFDLFANED